MGGIKMDALSSDQFSRDVVRMYKGLDKLDYVGDMKMVDDDISTSESNDSDSEETGASHEVGVTEERMEVLTRLAIEDKLDESNLTAEELKLFKNCIYRGILRDDPFTPWWTLSDIPLTPASSAISIAQRSHVCCSAVDAKPPNGSIIFDVVSVVVFWLSMNHVLNGDIFLDGKNEGYQDGGYKLNIPFGHEELENRVSELLSCVPLHEVSIEVRSIASVNGTLERMISGSVSYNKVLIHQAVKTLDQVLLVPDRLLYILYQIHECLDKIPREKKKDTMKRGVRVVQKRLEYMASFISNHKPMNEISERLRFCKTISQDLIDKLVL